MYYLLLLVGCLLSFKCLISLFFYLKTSFINIFDRQVINATEEQLNRRFKRIELKAKVLRNDVLKVISFLGFVSLYYYFVII